MKMWYVPWSDSIKKRACRYLLQRYLGNFLEEKLTLDQLSVDLYNGTGTVYDVSLDCEALNELGDAQSWPLEIIDGHMDDITVTIPWTNMFKDNTTVEVNGLSLTVQPKVRAKEVSSMLESMWSSMSSSMQLAADCLREESTPQDSDALEGIEMFAHMIDSILSKIKVRFVNTLLRIEHVPKNGDRGIAIEIHIEKIEYLDEAGSEPKPEVTDPEKSKTYIVATYSNKKVKFQGVSLYTDEFPSKLRTMARSLTMERSVSSQLDKGEAAQIETSDINFQSATSDVFYETRSVISTIEVDPIKEILSDSTHESVKEPTPEERASQPDPILFAKLSGEHEVVFKIKHTDEMEGPRIDVKMLLGSLVFFISPRQLHTLIELVNALNEPHLEDTSNIPLRSSGFSTQCKPMRPADYHIVEAQLLGNLQRECRSIPGMHGWSGPSLDESDNDSEIFHPMTSPGHQMTESFSSTASSMNTSITSSINTLSTHPRIKKTKKTNNADGDPYAEVSHISLRIESLSCILLHKDILLPTPLSSDNVAPASAHKMQKIAKEFFDGLEPFCISEGVKKELYLANEALDKAVGRNHLRLITSEMTLDGSEKVTSHSNQIMCEASIKHLLVRECLYTKNEGSDISTPNNYDLIRFDWRDEEENASKKSTTSRSSVRFNFKQTSKYLSISGEKKLVSPTTDIILKCAPFYVDVDLTLMNRMSATFFGGPKSTASTPVTPLSSQNSFNISLQCPDINATLRFPVADLRPQINYEMRVVRPDYLVFKFHNATISSQQISSVRQLPTTVTAKATMLDLFYHENDTLPATHIARTTMDESNEGNILRGNIVAPLPTISLTFKPQSNYKGPFDSLDDDASFQPPPGNPMTTSMYLINNLSSTEPSPFSGKKMAHQSITKHEGSTHEQQEELIVPGNEEEMAEFTSSAIEHALVHLDLDLPNLSLQLESKQLYEIIYNRINSDLLLWEPHFVGHYETSLQSQEMLRPFAMCVGVGYESDSGSSSSEEENLYYSTYDNKPKKEAASNKLVAEKKETHDFCLTLKVGKGLMTIYAPVRDSNKRVVPGQMGELVLEAQKLSMCHVSGINGMPKAAQMCLRSGKTTLYHEAILTIPSDKPSLRLYGTTLPSHLKKTIYSSGKGVIIKENLPIKDMFSLALKVEPDRDTPNLKAICIAMGIEQATLRHRGDKGIAWLTQLMDVLDVVDYPVPGYAPATVLSQLHVHILDCAIDYRPLYLPIRTVLTLGNFSVSSNVIQETNTSCLRFIAQECTLFLAHLNVTKPHVPVPQDDDKMPDIHKDYICVVDVDLFELSLRMEEKTTCPKDQPQIDLSASNNMVKLYTCWDSASALCRLVTYVAADGDSQPSYDPSSRHTSICSDQPLEPLIGLDDRPIEEIRELSPSEIQQVNDLMAEAMKESPNSTMVEEEFNNTLEKEGVEVFFFPDESNMKQRQTTDVPTLEAEAQPIRYEGFQPGLVEETQETKPINIQVARDLGDPTSTPKGTPRKHTRNKTKSGSDGGNTDDEYCIVDSQTYSEDDDLAEPVVTWYASPPKYIENHFTIPAARADILDPPKYFPPPLLRYTLCEMSVTWSLFGGNDFSPAGESTTAKKTVTIDPSVRKQGSPTTSKRSKEYEPYESGRASTAAYRHGVSWSAGADRVRPARGQHSAPAGPHAHSRRDLRARGGPQRDHTSRVNVCLTKVKFEYDVYPPGEKQASRQTLAIHRIEVQDRMSCSNVNKLLALYQLKDEPERPHAYMLVVKLVHQRPNPDMSAQESCMKVSMLPLRFNLDQDTLAFLASFFSKLGSDELGDDETTKSISGLSTESGGSRQTTPTHRPPVMSIGTHLRDPPPTPTSLGDADSLSLNETLIREDEPLMENYEAERLVSENLIQLEEDFNRLGMNQEKPPARVPVDLEPVDDSPVYFRRVMFTPEVPIQLDYIGKRVDLSAGPMTGLIMGLGQLNCSELTLKRLDHKLGLLGLEKVVQWALHEWLTDIKRNQLPGLLSGIGPMHSLLQLITGIRDLVWLPVEQWRRDGRLVHGLRRGAASFTARTAVAALDITTRLLHLIQDELIVNGSVANTLFPSPVPWWCGGIRHYIRNTMIDATAETAFEMLTPGPALPLADVLDHRERRRRRRLDHSRQPADIREGVASAYQTVKEGFAETAATMAMAARSERGGAVRVLRQLPGAAVAPLALAAAGAADVLGGVRAHLAPHRKRDHADRWRTAADSMTE